MRDSWLAVAVLLILVGIGIREAAPVGVGAVILLTGGLSRLWSRLALERVVFERQLENRRAFVGETVEVAFTLVNRKALPLPWVRVRDLVPAQAPPVDVRTSPSPAPESLYLDRSTSLASYERVTWRYRFRCRARGFYRFGPATLQSGDVFGFFPRDREDLRVDSLTVLPRLLDLREIGLPALRPFGEARAGSRLFEDQSRIAGVRDYRPGDPLKQIDWKATARRQHLQSRLFDPASTRILLVALNVDTLTHAWEGYDPLVLERAISVAGSVAQYSDQQRYAGGLVANCTFPNADRHIWIPPGRAPGQLTRMLESLAMVSPFTLAPLEEILRTVERRLPLGASIVLVAGSLTEPFRAYLAKRTGEAGHLSLVWVSDQAAPTLPPRIPVHDAGPHLREFERNWQRTHGGREPTGAWMER